MAVHDDLAVAFCADPLGRGLVPSRDGRALLTGVAIPTFYRTGGGRMSCARGLQPVWLRWISSRPHCGSGWSSALARSRTGSRSKTRCAKLVAMEAAALPGPERERLAEHVLRLATGLGPLEPLLADPDVNEVMVNGDGTVYVERAGRVESFGSSVHRFRRGDARNRADPRAARAAASMRLRRCATRGCPTGRGSTS